MSLILASISIMEFKNGYGDRALRFGILAAQDTWSAPSVPLAETALASATSIVNLQHILRGHTDRVGSCSFSSDSNRIVTASIDSRRRGTARLWNAKTGAQIGKDMKHKGRALDATLSLDNNLVITASTDGSTDGSFDIVRYLSEKESYP